MAKESEIFKALGAEVSNQTGEKLGIGAYLFGLLSFVPICGFLFGVISIVWGFLTKKQGRVALIAFGLLGIIIGAVFYSGFFAKLFFQSGAYDTFYEHNLDNLVRAIEFYKIQHGNYPESLGILIENDQSVGAIAVDPSAVLAGNRETLTFFYELQTDGLHYYLLGVGNDGIPFSTDDLLPKVDRKNTGLLIHSNSGTQ